MRCFPFVLQGFHSDNGSEYINKRVAELLEKLHIEFTKSRSRQSNDNALAESKNGAVVRKFFGYSHIPQQYAASMNAFNQQYINTYLNYHRPCFFPETRIDHKGKQRKVYPHDSMMTPYDKLKSLQYKREGCQHLLQYRHKILLADFLHTTDDFKLGDFIHGIDVINPFLAV